MKEILRRAVHSAIKPARRGFSSFDCEAPDVQKALEEFYAETKIGMPQKRNTPTTTEKPKEPSGTIANPKVTKHKDTKPKGTNTR